ncbi:MAG TPA: type II toxin-antitoxin system prevent-host-death family antitoxin [Vicinamibacterales bacterium]|nr:type II toxin-antitoxin system prevent-host-death family antitoxin [Vicinamibacterales bacterium]
MAKPHSIHAAKTQLSRLIERAERGEEVVIARGSTPVARLTRLRAERPARRFGAMRGRARVTRAFFEPLPESELKGWK